MHSQLEALQGLWQTSKINLSSANPTKWSNTLKQFVGRLPANCLSMFDHSFRLTLKMLRLKTVNINAKLFILDACRGSGYTFDTSNEVN